MKTKEFLGMLLMAFLVVAGLAACSDDNNGGDEPSPNPPTVTIARAFYDVAVEYAIDAKDKSGIEADLNANRPLPEGAQYGITARRVSIGVMTPEITLNLVNGKDTTLIGHIEEGEVADGWQKRYEILPSDKQSTDIRKWTIRSEEDVALFEYDVFVLESNSLSLYEDLTAKYKEMFPDVGVTSVVRRQTLTLKSEKEELQ